MAVSFVLADKGRDIAGDALMAALDDGVLELLETATLLVTLTLPDQATNTSVNGVITLGAITPAAAGAAGTANTAKFYNNGKANLIATANVGIGAGFSVNLDNNVIALAQVVTITSATITVPAGT